MQILITAGPTREYLDDVRFITNASSGQMGLMLADEAAKVGHRVKLLLAAGIDLPRSLRQTCERVRFTTFEDLAEAMDEYFDRCDVLLMAAAVGDFRTKSPHEGKLPRADGPVNIRLIPTEDLLAKTGRRKHVNQRIVAFAVESGPRDQIEAKARAEMRRKNADWLVLNRPEAMGATASEACVLSRDGAFVVPWARRDKRELAAAVMRLLTGCS
jgi:phosphopantothenoylcysteine decarboxylase/phosphopantothenate--cysteine ligase